MRASRRHPGRGEGLTRPANVPDAMSGVDENRTVIESLLMKFDANLRPLRLADVSTEAAEEMGFDGVWSLSPHTIRSAACAGGAEHH